MLPRAAKTRLRRQSPRGNDEGMRRGSLCIAKYATKAPNTKGSFLTRISPALNIRLHGRAETRAPRPALLQRRGSALRQRCRLGGGIFFLYLIVNLLGVVWLLPRPVEPGEFELRRCLADDQRRLVDQLLIKIDCLRVLILHPINGSQRKLAKCRKVGVRRAGRLLQTALRCRIIAKLCRGQAHEIARHIGSAGVRILVDDALELLACRRAALLRRREAFISRLRGHACRTHWRFKSADRR